MYEGFNREERLIGKENLEKLSKAKIAVFGIGGVGSFVVEGLARAGIGKFLLVDNDTVDITNINRQIHANITTVGKNKIDVMKERILSINPEAEVDVSTEFFMNIPIISAMGTGNKLDPTKFEVTDIYKTSVCPLAKVMRKELRLRGIKKLKVVYSKEEPIKPNDGDYKTPASISFVPSVAGLIIAGEVIKDIING